MIVVVLEGGLVSKVLSDGKPGPPRHVVIADRDVEGRDADEMDIVGGKGAVVRADSIVEDPQFCNEAWDRATLAGM